jgi:ribonuclease T
VTEETWISVDIESSGPTPSTGSMVAIGACVVDQPDVAFNALIRPIPGLAWSDEAEAVHGLSRARLAADGLDPAEATRAFVDWVDRTAGPTRPVFVAFNATYDWMFVADYAWRFVGRNPFGVSGLDIKALFLGRHLDVVHRWSETGNAQVKRRYHVALPHTHAPLDDAREQAAMCRLIREGARRGETEGTR